MNEKDRDLLRRAGEHIGTLAERTREKSWLAFSDQRRRRTLHERYARLTRLSREVLEVAND